MPLNPEELRRTSSQADQAQKAQLEIWRKEMAAQFPALFNRFLSDLEKAIKAAASEGKRSCVVLRRPHYQLRAAPHGEGALHPIKSLTHNFDPAICQMDEDSFGERVAQHFRSMGFEVKGEIAVSGQPWKDNVGTDAYGQIEVCW